MRPDITFGCLIAIFAALLAINDLVKGRIADQNTQCLNEKNNAYFWYQAKSIKESLAEGQRDLLTSLNNPNLQPHIAKLNTKIAQYKREKQEILLGSKAVGPKGYAQAIDGEMGKVTGAKELEVTIIVLSRAGDYFDLATLCLQLCLVIGAVGIIIQRHKVQKALFTTMIALGCAGIVAFIFAYILTL